jgi:hypothetical protein
MPNSILKALRRRLRLTVTCFVTFLFFVLQDRRLLDTPAIIRFLFGEVFFLAAAALSPRCVSGAASFCSRLSLECRCVTPSRAQAQFRFAAPQVNDNAAAGAGDDADAAAHEHID